MRLLTLAAAVAAVAVTTSQAAAHFVWVEIVPTEKGPTAQVYFSETPEAGSPELVGKIAHAKAWVRGIGAESKPLELNVEKHEETGALVAKLEQGAPLSLEADVEYGVFKRGETALLVHYYAKHLAGRNVADFAAIGRATELPLDIVPRVEGDKLRLTVSWQGKPAAGAELIVLDAAGEEQKLTTNEQGEGEVALKPGQQAVRARLVDTQNQGEKNGQAYTQAWHIATLTFEVPSETGKVATTVAAAPGEVSANDLLERARDARAVWNNFPGFKSHITVRVDDEIGEGELIVDRSGDVMLRGVSDNVKGWASQQLQLLIRHRLPAPFSESDVVYGDDGKNPLGRLIKFEGDSAHSAYRVKDDVIREVNRHMGKMRFTISTLEVARNDEGKYMPQSYSASYWDVASGKLISNEAVLQKWVKVGKFELPAEHVVVKSADGSLKVLQITFSEHELTPAGEVSSNLR
ncbi:MAG: DUF3386 family protein [Planctomycetaceae bacterium]|nr:DUF3386 family protein [Planctomycetaceae bacterium]